MFEKASRLKLRFATIGGNFSVEDLWDLPLLSLARDSRVSLDNLAKILNREVKDSEEGSFVVKKSGKDAILSLKFDIVKHVISVKLADAEANEKAEEVRAKKQRILEIMSDKADESLKSKSTDELKKILDELG